MDELNRKQAWVLSATALEFRYSDWQPNVEVNHLCIYSKLIEGLSERLEKHYILKLICFKLLGHCNIFTFLLSFFYISWLSLCYLIDHVYISVAFDFWYVFFWHTVFSLVFGICFLAYSVLKSISSAFLLELFGISKALTILRELDPCAKLYVFWP